MDVSAKCATGDRVQILLGSKWHRAEVVRVWRWQHSCGNSFPVYTVRFGNGKELHCGNNSIRPAH